MVMMVMMMSMMRMTVMLRKVMRMTMPQVKINGSSEEMLAFAAEMFGDKSTEEVESSFIILILTDWHQFKLFWQVLAVCLATMEGHQRAIMGNMTVEEIYKDRQTFSTRSIISAIFSTRSIFFAICFYTMLNNVKTIFSTMSIFSTIFSRSIFNIVRNIFMQGV